MDKIKKVLLIGSGALKIGQAGEFDYSGSQALKALKEEGIKSVLVNPNVATIQTSKKLADKIYFLPVSPDFVEKVIEKEKPDGILLGFGGQSGLNCGLSLAKKGIFKKYKIKVLGTPIKAIEDTEDRQKFVDRLAEINLLTPKSQLATNLTEAKKAAKKIGFPLILRVGFALGGLGSSLVKDKKVGEAVEKALSRSPQVLVEEYLGGWKEIEFEVVRDRFDNCLTVCSMENIDPMGIHTGDSIVIAPAQTLNQNEYFFLREKAIRLIRHLKIVGECNIQFAVRIDKFDYRIIEINARLSRSSALASKASGYPLAFVATKLALGKGLHEIKNSITKKTTAFFEPALDYVVIKFPRWDLEKFKNAVESIGSEMKSVGEVMAIGRNFQECLQKAIRMLNQSDGDLIGQTTFDYCKLPRKKLLKLLTTPTSKRMFIVIAGLLKNISLKKINQITKIDPFFLEEIKKITDFYQILLKSKRLDKKMLKKAKILGFSDEQLAKIAQSNFKQIRNLRKKWQIIPCVKQIDTLAAEFPAKANYLYLTYQGEGSDLVKRKCRPYKKAIILGSGPYCIGSSVEFDWCAVNAALSLRKQGLETIMVNCNPETVSTDFDIADLLYFEELSLERVLDIYEKEKPEFIVLSFGGQISNNLAKELSKFGVKILGTKPVNIDKAEDRKKFSKTLDRLGIKQAPWRSFSKIHQAISYADKIGYPVLVRPSYVLSGAAMFVAYRKEELKIYIKRSIKVSRQYPLVISKFIERAKEIEIDGVGSKGKLVAYAIGEHVEYAGVHSGDATIVIPPQRVTLEILRNIKKTSRKIVRALKINGPFNIQFLAKDGEVFVIETNLRASRSFPFASKVVGLNFAELAIRAMLGEKIDGDYKTIDLDYVGVKSPQFSFSRLSGADPILRVEMASTGEAACLGEDLSEAFMKSLLAVDFSLPKKRILLSLGGIENKINFLPEALTLKQAGFSLLATDKSHKFFKKNKIESKKVFKVYEDKKPSVVDLIKEKQVDLVINLSEKPDNKEQREVFQKEITDGYLIRRASADFQVPLITNPETAKLFVQGLTKLSLKDLKIKPWDFYTKNVF